ncbi:hypothetical protein [Deinococcus pimensis]|uniref:hypothetical protein n=1 Tax=Deinococcus pimensis TaxID=309888 RepID=UPI000485C9E6|nr:hypothetical protein [Deinococcus pimensis]
MATTFEVYPGSAVVPSFEAVRALSEHKLHAFLRDHDLPARPRVNVERYRSRISVWGDEPVELDVHAPFLIPDGEYAWFTVQGESSGTDASTHKVRTLTKQDPDLGLPFPAEHLLDGRVLDAARTVGRCWSFRRSAGQPALVNVLYGTLASALAELTLGVVYSDDGAWDYQAFPARPDDFDRVYLRADAALSDKFRTWSELNLTWLRETPGT